MNISFDVIQTLATVATATGVFVAARQLRLSKQIAVLSFEDKFAFQYRKVIGRIPVEALLGEQLNDHEYRKALPDFFHYFDLSNEQAYLNRSGRVSDSTWAEWSDGITQNLSRPAFARAWEEVSRRAPDSFNDLRSALPDVPALGRAGDAIGLTSAGTYSKSVTT